MKRFTLLFSVAIATFMMSFIILKPNTEGYEIGDKVKDFSLKNIDGKMVSMADYKDAKGYIIVFTCNHCPFSKAYEKRIIALDKKYAPKGFPVIAINPNDAKDYPTDSYLHMKKRAKDKGFTFPYLVDETQAVAKAFGAKKTPHVFIVKKAKNKRVLKYEGGIDDNKTAGRVKIKYVEKVVDALLNGKKAPYTNTKAVGCGIKWK